MRAPVRVSSFLHDMGGWGADSVQLLILVYVDEGLQPTRANMQSLSNTLSSQAPSHVKWA